MQVCVCTNLYANLCECATVCVCVCVCARAHACVHVCACVFRQACLFMSLWRPQLLSVALPCKLGGGGDDGEKETGCRMSGSW